ncbi:MAG: PAS domain-containing protein [Chloroflexi bacterium]|nr:PAS domain-containing protein [Chloroflexota bacterium]
MMRHPKLGFRSVLSSLQARLLLLIVFILVPVLLLTWYTVSQQSAFALRKARQDALRLAQLSASNQEQFITSAQQLLVALAQIPAVKSGDAAACDALFVSLREQFTTYTNVFMVDTNGDTVCTGIPVTPPVNVVDRLWFRRAMERMGFSVGDFEIGIVSKRPVVTLSYPVFDENNRVKYQLGLSLDLRKVGDLITSAALPPDATITAIDRKGIVLYRYPSRDDLIGKPHWNPQVVQTVLAEQSGTVEGTGLDGSYRLFGFTPLDKTNGSAYVIVGMSYANAFADANELFLQYLVALGLVGIVSLAVAFVGARRLVVQPTRQLVASTDRLAAGDLTARVDTRQVEHTNELLTLARAFNHMAESLEQRQRDLQQSNLNLAAEISERKKIEAELQAARDSLEITVHERTAELVFLSEASRILASDLDSRKTLQRVAELVVPDIADGCAIHLLDDDHILRLVAAAPTLDRIPTGLAEQVIDSRHRRQFQTDEQVIECVPVKIQGRAVGTISCGRVLRNSEPTPYANLLDELARRVAVALDNARLYRQVYEHRERLLVTLGSIGDGVVATDENGCVTFMNAIAQGLTGWTEAEAIGRHLSDVFQICSEATGEPVQNPALLALAEGRIIGLNNHTILTARNGTQYPIDDSGAPILDENRRIIGSILVFRDITERRRRELAEQEQRALSDALRDTALTLTGTLHLSEVLDRILANVGRVVPHDTADIMFIEAGEARIVRSQGYERWGVDTTNLVFPVNDTATLNQMMATAEPMLIPDVRQFPAWVLVDNQDWMRSYVGVPIILQSEIIGFLNLTSTTVDFFTPVHADHLQAFAAQAAIAIQNAQLYEEAQTLAAMEERQRLAYDLHDAVSQMLFSSSLLSESLPRLWKRNPDKVEPQLEQLTRLNRGAHAELRNLLMELSPTNLIKTNMHELLRQLALATSARTNLRIDVHVNGQTNFPPDVHMTLYRIAQEALNNIVKHARATQVDIALTSEAGRTVLRVRDNGRGFDPQHVQSRSMGLSIMQERARSIGAVLELKTEIGQGTEIIAIWARDA